MITFALHFGKRVKERIPWAYRAVKAYFRFMINGLYNRRYYCLDVENVPADGTPVLMVSNHQNCLNDALGVLLAVNDRKMRFITRADAFTINPLFKRFLLWIGLLPAYRFQHEGEEQLSNNEDTFHHTEQDLLDGHAILIYPEAGHQDRHWLGFFTSGYTLMAFEAARKTGFQKEIFILPSANHYSDYFGLRNDMLVRFGKPISIQPYYELYQSQPRTAQREVNHLVRTKIREMMLDVQDLAHYDDIDYLRNSGFGCDFARFLQKDPGILPQKLEADKELVARLDAASVPYDDVRSLREEMASLGLEDRQFERKPTLLRVIALGLGLLLTLPLAIVALWPAIFAWVIPNHFVKKLDVMFQGTFVLAINVLVLLPVSALVTLLVEWRFIGAWSLLHAAALPFLCLFEWEWCRQARRWLADCRFLKAGRRVDALRVARQSIFDQLKSTIYHG